VISAVSGASPDFNYTISYLLQIASAGLRTKEMGSDDCIFQSGEAPDSAHDQRFCASFISCALLTGTTPDCSQTNPPARLAIAAVLNSSKPAAR